MRSAKNRPAFPRFEPQGKKLFQQRAVEAFPLLVRQAKAGNIIYYSDLADELGMKLARNLNYPLGAIAGAVQNLGTKWNRQLPHLEFLVVNKKTGIPGKGVFDFIPHPDEFRRGTPGDRRRIIDLALRDVFSFREWDKVLAHFGLQPPQLPSPPPTSPARPDSRGMGSGEGEDHKLLKDFIAQNPHAIGLKGFSKGKVEHTFPSQDTIDVLFAEKDRWVGVEIKGIRSDEVDIRRGLYQCVKYKALLEAVLKVEQKQIPMEVILVLGGKLPETLRPEKATLGVTCLSEVSMPPTFKS